MPVILSLVSGGWSIIRVQRIFADPAAFSFVDGMGRRENFTLSKIYNSCCVCLT